MEIGELGSGDGLQKRRRPVVNVTLKSLAIGQERHIAINTYALQIGSF